MTSQIFEQHLLPNFTVPYFSGDLQAEETWLLSIKFPPLDHNLQKQHPASEHTIPPYIINHNIKLHHDLIDHVVWATRITTSSRITAIMDKWAHQPPLDRVKSYTHFLEYHLLAYTTFFHSNIADQTGDSLTSFYNWRTPKYFAQWFLYAHPSTKVLVGLWTLRYLVRRVESNWEPPKGFCSGAVGFLEKHKVDPTGELYSWLGGLTECEAYSGDSDEEDMDE
ncbi:hypothetical protein GALMADRAFT_400605 [Galerina marginata CBS 339.88]|uniref:Uncharacterized protein n=1 Tax=Galerina marginata (strain CBS 339.88) TaxID=685588 RepID=A0A067TUQ6_GALM3|nr:hypothetical protein GALMADRAFT_400605 [Galerina marginata CBS 339.88]